jgi:hypothetical protein
MSKEENRKRFDNLDQVVLHDKLAEAMVDLIKNADQKDGFATFDYILKNFTKDEMAFISCVHVAERVALALQGEDTSIQAIAKLVKLMHEEHKKSNN